MFRVTNDLPVLRVYVTLERILLRVWKIASSGVPHGEKMQRSKRWRYTSGVIVPTSRGISGLETTTFSPAYETKRRIMSTGISKSPDTRYWRQLYRAALSEIDKSQLPERIAEAEKAVVLRAQELFSGSRLSRRLR